VRPHITATMYMCVDVGGSVFSHFIITRVKLDYIPRWDGNIRVCQRRVRKVLGDSTVHAYPGA
jgi:hypothetical protein